MSDLHKNPSTRVYRPQISSITLCLLTTLYLLSISNRTFWSKAFGYFAADHLSFAWFMIGIFAACLAFVTVFSAKFIFKPFLIFFIVVASVASWFTDSFGVIVDKEMIRNAAVSTTAEAGRLITARFLLHLFWSGILPSLIIVWVRVRHRRILPKLLENTGVILICLAVFSVATLGNYKTFSGVGRAHRDILDTLNPLAPIASAVRLFVASRKESDIVAKPLGVDAVRINRGSMMKHRVLIIVVGETARAQNFSLGGYMRETNPQLKQQNVIYFRNTTSCGTSTAVSLPCMFSVYPRKDYSHRKGLETQNLLDVLAHANVATTWLDNDTGSYRVAERSSYQFLPHSADPRFCKDGECLDEILVDRVDGWLDQVKGDSVLVLHQLGSHGPAYYARYPEEFRQFKPDCRANDFGRCTTEEIRNAYDNSILYTDHIVSSVIDKVRSRSDSLSGAVVYLSDHGESLGENGLYLHGAPYLIAPAEQTSVPFLVWLSEDLQRKAGFDVACLSAAADSPVSHDNFFHSILGLMDISTNVYGSKLDVFSKCRTAIRTTKS